MFTFFVVRKYCASAKFHISEHNAVNRNEIDIYLFATKFILVFRTNYFRYFVFVFNGTVFILTYCK